MGVTFEEAKARLLDAATEIFGGETRARAVGIGRHGDGFGYEVVRNAGGIKPLSLRSIRASAAGVPVTYRDASRDPMPLVRVRTYAGNAKPLAEQSRHRHLHCGIEIQNWDDDDREGVSALGEMNVGTLGCFVVRGDELGILTNNHVAAAHNDIKFIGDRIVQPGGGASCTDDVASLSYFATLNPSPSGASLQKKDCVWNDVDAAFAIIKRDVGHAQCYVPTTGNLPLTGIAIADVDDLVFKVGRTTGLTRGRIVAVDTLLQNVSYRTGEMWFRRALTIESANGGDFADEGDSGSVVVKDTGEIVGLLFAGSGHLGYACPIDVVFSELSLSLAPGAVTTTP